MIDRATTHALDLPVPARQRRRCTFPLRGERSLGRLVGQQDGISLERGKASATEMDPETRHAQGDGLMRRVGINGPKLLFVLIVHGHRYEYCGNHLPNYQTRPADPHRPPSCENVMEPRQNDRRASDSLTAASGRMGAGGIGIADAVAAKGRTGEAAR